MSFCPKLILFSGLLLVVLAIYSPSTTLAAVQVWYDGSSAPTSQSACPTTGSFICEDNGFVTCGIGTQTTTDLTPCQTAGKTYSNTCNTNNWTFTYAKSCTGTASSQGGFCSVDFNYDTHTCSVADTCYNQPYLNPGVCDASRYDGTNPDTACVSSPTTYKTCCNSNGTVDGSCNGGDHTGTCPAGTITVFCGFGGYASCGAAACATIAPPPPPPPSTCSDGTARNTCSSTKPLFCDNNGNLINASNTCGCPSGQSPQPDGTCATTNVTTPTCNFTNSYNQCCANGYSQYVNTGNWSDGSGSCWDTGPCNQVDAACGTTGGGGGGPPGGGTGGGTTSCGASCTYSQSDGTCHQGNCLDGSQNCSTNVNCGFISNCSSGTQVSCSGGGTPGGGGGGTPGGGGGSDVSIPRNIANLVCLETVSTDGVNWSNSVAANPGQQVEFRMQISNSGNGIPWYGTRNNFQNAINGYTNIWQNSIDPLGGVFWLIRSSSLPGISWDNNYYQSGGEFCPGCVDTTNWSEVLINNPQIFKNQGYAAVGLYTAAGNYTFPGGCNPDTAPGNQCCWIEPASGGQSCISFAPSGGCNPSYSAGCSYTGTFQCNEVTVSKSAIVISGYIKDSQSGAGIPNVAVQVYDDAFKNLPVNTQTAITDANGYWQVVNFVRPGDAYAVRIPGNSNPQTAPTGFAPPARTSTSGWTWNYAANPNTDVLPGSYSYEGQLAGSNDCAGPNNLGNTGRCSFTYDSDNPKGYLDGADCNSFIGWSCDASNYNQPIDVHFYANGPAGSGSYIDTTIANQPREQAVANLCGGKPNHGFVFTTPNSLKDGQNHSIYAYGINIPPGNNPQLSGVPKTINCPAAPGGGGGGGVPGGGGVAVPKYRCAVSGSACIRDDANGTYTSLATCNTDCVSGGNTGANTPWIQTTGGDVHSNTSINTRGGP